MTENKLVIQSMAFAKDIVILCRSVKSQKKESILSNQLLRSGTSIGANIHEANYAQSKLDFINKLQIALKECYETEYWLELLFQTDSIEQNEATNLIRKCGTL